MKSVIKTLEKEHKELCRQYGVFKNAGFSNTAKDIKLKIDEHKLAIEILKPKPCPRWAIQP